MYDLSCWDQPEKKDERIHEIIVAAAADLASRSWIVNDAQSESEQITDGHMKLPAVRIVNSDIQVKSMQNI